MRRPVADQDVESRTRRYREVARLTADGWTSERIAWHLGVSQRTVVRWRRAVRAGQLPVPRTPPGQLKAGAR